MYVQGYGKEHNENDGLRTGVYSRSVKVSKKKKCQAILAYSLSVSLSVSVSLFFKDKVFFPLIFFIFMCELLSEWEAEHFKKDFLWFRSMAAK